MNAWTSAPAWPILRIAFCLTSASTHPPPSVPAWPPAGSTSIKAPAFWGGEPRVSTTWQSSSSLPRSRLSIKCRSKSRIAQVPGHRRSHKPNEIKLYRPGARGNPSSQGQPGPGIEPDDPLGIEPHDDRLADADRRAGREPEAHRVRAHGQRGQDLVTERLHAADHAPRGDRRRCQAEVLGPDPEIDASRATSSE